MALSKAGIASVLVVAAIVGDCQTSLAQRVVQLPTFDVFSVNTTVVVPDRGSVFLGGNSSSSSGRDGSGVPLLGGRPFTNVGIGRTSAAGGVSVSAQIHDLEAMDAALLAQTAGDSQQSRQTASQPASAASVAQIRADAAAKEKAKQQEGADHLAHARQLMAEGNAAVAKIYFQMAARGATGEVQQQALAALRALERPNATSAVTAR
jgi:hypothetical protein